MPTIRGKLETTISLHKSTCYFLKTGRCSLNVVTDYYVTPALPSSPSDLLYCPRLYRAMQNREKLKPITVVPCACGHVQVTAGQQRACIAARKGLELVMRAESDEMQEACKICGDGQLTLEEASGGDHILTVRAILHKEEEP